MAGVSRVAALVTVMVALDEAFADARKARVNSEIAAAIVAQSADPDDTGDDPYEGKNRAAVELGRLGGLKGGKARAAKLTPEERSEIARKAARARWEKSD